MEVSTVRRAARAAAVAWAVLTRGLGLAAFAASPTLAADLGVADLPEIHAEYEANQARWAREFLNKAFVATMKLNDVHNAFGNNEFTVTFVGSSGRWTSDVACSNVPASDFLISKNKGDSIFFRGIVADHAFGTLYLRDCEFGPDAVTVRTDSAPTETRSTADDAWCGVLKGRTDADSKALIAKSCGN